MKITLCSSASFFSNLQEISVELCGMGYDVFFPHIWDWKNKSEDEISKIQSSLIKRHFLNIQKSDAIYVANYDKNGTIGYIGGNCFLEMGKAFDVGIPIFLLKDIPNVGYREELLALQPIVIGEDWDSLDRIVRECCNKKH